MTHPSQGFTMLELLIALSILGILLAIGVTQFRPPVTRLFANDLKVVVQQARYEAIKRNRPVAVTWDAVARRFTTRVHVSNSDVSAACTGSTVLRTKAATEYPRLVVSSQFATGSGVVWLPNGQGRKCDGGVLEAVRTTITDGQQTRHVDLSPTGSVTIQ